MRARHKVFELDKRGFLMRMRESAWHSGRDARERFPGVIRGRRFRDMVSAIQAR
jgi:hypothetical protein